MSESLSPEPPDMTGAEFTRLLEEEVSSLDASTREIFDMYAIPPVRAIHRWQHEGRVGEAPVWVVAMSGSAVIGYDEVEDEYGVGRARVTPVAHGHTIDDWGTFGQRIRWTLLRFPSIIVRDPLPSD